MRRYPIALTDKGRVALTQDLLLNTLIDLIYQGLSADEYDTTVCAYVVSFINSMGHLGYVEGSTPPPDDRNPGAKAPSEPPSWLRNWEPPKDDNPSQLPPGMEFGDAGV